MRMRDKASRYDALQAAIKTILEGYRKRQKEYESKYDEDMQPEIFKAYSKGASDAYCHVINDLERWRT